MVLSPIHTPYLTAPDIGTHLMVQWNKKLKERKNMLVLINWIEDRGYNNYSIQPEETVDFDTDKSLCIKMDMM